jgi:hypothetical protein
MNIFVLDLDFEKNASYYVDSHVSKMVLETAQILCSVHHISGTDSEKIPYKLAHRNHPCVKWASESIRNYNWLTCLGMALSYEFEYRREKFHKSSQVIEWALDNDPKIVDKGLTPFALAMPDIYKSDDPIESYRDYYAFEKWHLFKWTKREIPKWIEERLS